MAVDCAQQPGYGMGREQTCLLLGGERLVCGQDDQQLLQGSPFDGFHLDLWIAAGRRIRNGDTLQGPGCRKLGLIAHQPAQGGSCSAGEKDKCVQSHLGTKAYGRDNRANGRMPACCSPEVNRLRSSRRDMSSTAHHRPL